MCRRQVIALAVILLTLTQTCLAEDKVKSSKVRDDERIIFFPTAAHQSDDGVNWIVPIHGWIFEPEEKDIARRLVEAGLTEALDIDDQPPAKQRIFHQRIRNFLVDNESGKRIAISIGTRRFVLENSHKDGHFQGEIELSVGEVSRLSRHGKLTFNAVTHNDDGREFAGEVLLIGPTGLSIISDIDDTIKVTQVTDRKAMLRRTFLEPFEPVPGMANLYQQWAAAAKPTPGESREPFAVAFHFVSSSPWQLYEPLAKFTCDEDFPPATFHLKRFRLRPSGVMALLADPLETKPQVIRRILETYPKRKFVLVGDSGEKDPEVYATIAREFPEQIASILIRDVTDEAADSPRYHEAFDGVPDEKWQVFTDPTEIKSR